MVIYRILGCIYMLVRNIDFAHDGTDLELRHLASNWSAFILGIDFIYLTFCTVFNLQLTFKGAIAIFKITQKLADSEGYVAVVNFNSAKMALSTGHGYKYNWHWYLVGTA